MTFSEALQPLLQGSRIRSEIAGGKTIFLFYDHLHAENPTYSHFEPYALRRVDIEATDWEIVDDIC